MPLFLLRRRHLDVLTTEMGIVQHAQDARPDPRHGYCTDDVARAPMVDLLHQRELGWEAVATSAGRSVTFLAEALLMWPVALEHSRDLRARDAQATAKRGGTFAAVA